MDESTWMDLAEEAGQLREAMTSRATIEEAKGVLMTLRRCDADAAYDELVTVSKNANVKVRDLSAALVRAVADDSDADRPVSEREVRAAKVVAEQWAPELPARRTAAGQ